MRSQILFPYSFIPLKDVYAKVIFVVKVDVKHETTPSGAYLRDLFSSLDRESSGARYLVLYRKL